MPPRSWRLTSSFTSIVPHLGWGRSAFAGCAMAVRRQIREIRPDIVHGQGTERDCAMSAVFSGYPNVLTIHGNMRALALRPELRASRYYKMISVLESFCLRRTAGVICNSAYTEDLVSPRARRTWRVPNAIQSEFFQVSNSLSRGEVPQILNVGTITPWKCQLEVLIEIRLLWQQGYRFKMLFAGELSTSSSYGKDFHEELQRAEEAGYATHVGFLDVHGLIELMDQSHAMIHCPSEEAFGLVVAEAMARGLKFFGSNVGGVRDIACMIDEAELDSDICNLMEQVRLWIESGAPRSDSLKERMASLYHPRVIAERHIEIYKEARSNKRLS
ncbi:hypothetical protein BSZ32_05905 [Rubritalea profundi]|uniref:Glycosyl transferase family 1 domain-containing protein n=2 Tax=Rubritalea profundi TaxID=1658618 RepID=A0A2S7U1N0_9BACT|nr:hypothetical protein BSZ32_05905 [Rubritalea profundi]